MNFNYKLYFKYILLNKNQIFLKYLNRNDKNNFIVLNQNFFYYLSLHLKLSSLFYSLQLIDIFAYELPNSKNFQTNKNNSHYPFLNNSLIIYNFHSVFYQQRFFFLILNNNKEAVNKNFVQWQNLNSIADLFQSSNWLERELSELHSIFFANKKDIRNLMLPYGDTSAPMNKSFPSIGFREIFYDSITDMLIQNPVSIQF